MTWAISPGVLISYFAKTAGALAIIPARKPGIFASPLSHRRVNASPKDDVGISTPIEKVIRRLAGNAVKVFSPGMSITYAVPKSEASRSWPRAALTFYWTLGVPALLLFAFGQFGFVSQFVNSDRLLIVDWAHHVFDAHYAWGGFQLPRTSSLFPDFLISVPIQVATQSWRMALFAGACIYLAGLFLAIVLVVRRLVDSPLRNITAAAVTVVLPILLVEALSSSGGRHFGVIYPATHGGSFIISIFAAILVERYLTSPSRLGLASILGLCIFSVLSDRLFVFYFCFPTVAALTLCRASRREALQITATITLGSVVGWFPADLFNHQADFPLNFQNILATAQWFLKDMRPSVILGSVVPAVAVAAGALYAISRMPAGERRPFVFYTAFGLVSTLGTVALTAGFLYENQGAYRYLLPLMWWPLVAAIAWVTHVLRNRERLASMAATAVVTLTVGLSFVTGMGNRDSLWRWTDPLVACLQTNHLQSGVAGYWDARRIEVLSDWSLQIDPINPTGTKFYWGNDLASYGQSQFDLTKAPDYRFVVMDSIEPASIIGWIGQPQSKLSCGSSVVWIYPRFAISPK